MLRRGVGWMLQRATIAFQRNEKIAPAFALSFVQWKSRRSAIDDDFRKVNQQLGQPLANFRWGQFKFSEMSASSSGLVIRKAFQIQQPKTVVSCYVGNLSATETCLELGSNLHQGGDREKMRSPKVACSAHRLPFLSGLMSLAKSVWRTSARRSPDCQKLRNVSSSPDNGSTRFEFDFNEELEEPEERKKFLVKCMSDLSAIRRRIETLNKQLADYELSDERTIRWDKHLLIKETKSRFDELANYEATLRKIIGPKAESIEFTSFRDADAGSILSISGLNVEQPDTLLFTEFDKEARLPPWFEEMFRRVIRTSDMKNEAGRRLIVDIFIYAALDEFGGHLKTYRELPFAISNAKSQMLGGRIDFAIGVSASDPFIAIEAKATSAVFREYQCISAAVAIWKAYKDRNDCGRCVWGVQTDGATWEFYYINRSGEVFISNKCMFSLNTYDAKRVTELFQFLCHIMRSK